MIHIVVYLASGVALWRLWHGPHRILWRCIVALVILMYWTAETIRTAFKDALQRSAVMFDPSDPVEAVFARSEAMKDDVVRFWTFVNLAVVAATLITSIVAIVLTLR